MRGVWICLLLYTLKKAEFLQVFCGLSCAILKSTWISFLLPLPFLPKANAYPLSRSLRFQHLLMRSYSWEEIQAPQSCLLSMLKLKMAALNPGFCSASSRQARGIFEPLTVILGLLCAVHCIILQHLHGHHGPKAASQSCVLISRSSRWDPHSTHGSSLGWWWH